MQYMRHLIITGAQATGKSSLMDWISPFNKRKDVYLIDGASKKDIVLSCCDKPNANLLYVFTTNEEITYKDVDKETCLIIKLTTL